MRNPRETCAGIWAARALSVSVLAVLTALALPLAGDVPEQPERGRVMVGKDLFKSYCSSCHGPVGQGDGPIAEYLVVAPKDLTKLATDDGTFPYDEVIAQIDGRKAVRAHGSQDMPIWGEVFKEARAGADEADVRDKLTSLTHYLWSIQAKPAS